MRYYRQLREELVVEEDASVLDRVLEHEARTSAVRGESAGAQCVAKLFPTSRLTLCVRGGGCRTVGAGSRVVG